MQGNNNELHSKNFDKNCYFATYYIYKEGHSKNNSSLLSILRLCLPSKN